MAAWWCVDLEPGLPVALWLLPAQPWATQLDRVIAELADRYGSPRLPPHVTLSSAPSPGRPDELQIALEALAKEWGPITLQVAELAWGDDRFTRLSLRLRLPPAAAPSEATQIQTSQLQTGPIETAPIDTAPIERAAIRAAPIEAGLIERALQLLPGGHGPAIGLHLSLLYADPPPETPAPSADASPAGPPGEASDLQALSQSWGPRLTRQPSRAEGEGVILFDQLALVQPGPGGWRRSWPWNVVTRVPLRGSPPTAP